MSTVQPWLRRYNYISDYFETAYEHYIKEYPAFPVTYYATDHDETVWENENLLGGSYEKLGVGELSGQQWIKISLLPVFGLEQVQPTGDSEEKGLRFGASISTQLAIPSVYGLKPAEGDFVDISFGIKTESVNERLMVVTNVNLAHFGDFYNIYQCQLKGAPHAVRDLELQVSTHWKFLEFTKTILPLENANFLLRLQERSASMSTRLNSLFDNTSGFYFIED